MRVDNWGCMIKYPSCRGKLEYKCLMSARFQELNLLCLSTLEHRCSEEGSRFGGFGVRGSGLGSRVLPLTNVTLFRHMGCLSLSLIGSILCLVGSSLSEPGLFYYMVPNSESPYTVLSGDEGNIICDVRFYQPLL